MVQWPQPTNIKALGGFLGLTSHYRKFVPNYRVIAAPLTAMLKKNAFQRAEEAIDSFHKMKQAMSKPPILALPNFSKTFVIK